MGSADLPMVAVIDIDGVLADVRHRLRHVSERPTAGRAFFDGASEGPLLDGGAETVPRLAEVYDIVYLSGRPERLRGVTERWFRRHGLPTGPPTLPPHDEFRPPRVLKA